MSNDALHQLAARAGIAVRWSDYRGQPREVGSDSLRRLLVALELPCGSTAEIAGSLARITGEGSPARLPPLITARAGAPVSLPDTRQGTARIVFEDGEKLDLVLSAGADGHAELPAISRIGYHRLQLDDCELGLAIAPTRAFGVADLGSIESAVVPASRRSDHRLWGLAAQVYSLRRPGDGGIGDFTGLAAFARQAADRGADAVAVSPLHALFAADVQRFSPYAPSSRLFLNPLYVDPATSFGGPAVRALIAELGLGETLQRLESLALVDWPEAATARYRILRGLFERHARQFAGAGRSALAQEFQAFRKAGGAPLEDHAHFEALQAQQLAIDPSRWHWREWPQAFRDPRSSAVAAFAAENAEEVSFHAFLQWLADRGLAEVQGAARAAGMRVGLIGDLAVGTDSGGSHSWSRQRDMLAGLSVGAPPDLLNLTGQSWGLTAFSPRALAHYGYAPFIEMLRASLRHAGGLRIDHVLGLARLWLVPEGGRATEGAYLHYPLQDLLRLVALESWRHRAVIVGEDLGTVPDGFREQLAGAGVMGMRVLWFERDHELFIDPSRWPTTAMATTTTHDLPTVAGWWAGRDIDWRANLGLLPPDMSEVTERELRARERRTLWDAFAYAGVAAGGPPTLERSETAVDAALKFVARTEAPLVIVPVEDVLGLEESPNLPGTTDEHPNWRRRLPAPSDEILATPVAAARLQSLREGRDR